MPVRIILTFLFGLSVCLFAVLSVKAQQERTADRILGFGNEDNVVVRYSPDGGYIAAGGMGYAVLLDAKTGDSLRRFFDVPGRPVYSLEWSPDGKRIVGTSFEKSSVWNMATWEEEVKLGGDSLLQQYAAAWSRDGSMIATGDFDGVVRVWRVGDGALLHRFPCPSSVRNLAFFNNDYRLFAVCNDGAVRIWDLADGQTLLWLWVIGESRQVKEQAAFGTINSDGTMIATWSTDDPRTTDVTLTSPVTGKFLGALTGHSQGSFSHRFTSNGEYLISGGADSTARLWRIADRALVAVFRGHQGSVQSLDLSPDETELVTIGQDSTIRFWNLSGLIAPSNGVTGEPVSQPDSSGH